MASPARSILPRLEPTASPRQPAVLTNDVLEEIFLRVATHGDLARASAACVSFRRLIADPNFLRRFRSRHPPLLLGFLGGVGHEAFQPVEAPHPNAPVARALCRAGVFSFDYLPDCGEPGWSLSDVCDGRLLLEAEGSPVHGNGANRFAWPDLAVCDPLSRQYLLLPRMPEDLLAFLQIKGRDINDFDDLLVPSGDWEETSFRVLRMVQSRTTSVVLVFSSTSSCWSVGASTSWDVSFHIPPRQPVLGRPQFAHGCCYCKLKYLNKLLKLDMNTMEFSTIDLPPDNESHSMAIVEAAEGNLGMFSVISDIEVTSVQYYIFVQNLSGRANEWHIKKTIPLPDRCFYEFIGSAQGYVFLVRMRTGPFCNLSQSHFEYVCFSLESKTANIQRVSGMGPSFSYLYFGFPSSLSPRRIQGYEALQG
ncbi:unnamed protein product [Urochloa decumbens]|uniref:F-box protein AT5G49610-like beta-propeller domain-containing protein n=1 Tax=Urochloa decumbens TaxID=240449 RepID=A0ABC9FX68_9POAL